jgi:hypothetical protein
MFWTLVTVSVYKSIIQIQHVIFYPFFLLEKQEEKQPNETSSVSGNSEKMSSWGTFITVLIYMCIYYYHL